MDPNFAWKKISAQIKLKLSPGAYRTFFTGVSVDSLDEQTITFKTPAAFIAANIKTRYLQLLEQIMEDIFNTAFKIEFIVKAPAIASNEEAEEIFTLVEKQSSSLLNSKYTLENFVVGTSNNVAYAAALAVVQNPGLSYNPLFIYGGTGVGKTHLMLAVGNALLKKNLNTKVIYGSSEKFMNDYVEAIQTHKMGDLRRKYRSPDILLIDDIQFFSGREGTQEEFFHTFNELVGKNSQIILTSDRSPHEIPKLEDRLKSRFAGGLMVDIQAPDFDTRVAILRAKCQEQNMSLSEETLQLIASSFDTNIRELEGKLVGILQNLKAQNLQPTPDNISIFLKIPTKNIKVEPKKVIEIVCDYFNLNQKDLFSPNRQKELVLPRHITMFILSEDLNMTVEKIGQILGKRDHTTVMHGRDKIKNLSSKDREIQRMLLEIRNKFAS